MRLHNLALLAILVTSGCASAPQSSGSNWQGRSAGVVKVRLYYTGDQLPDSGWLVESTSASNSGIVRFTKWGPAGYRYKKEGFFVVEKEWRANATHLGLLRTNDRTTEFCTLNPEHGAYMDGDSIVHTYSWDYCAQLSRK